MRHRLSGRRLGRGPSHQKAMFRAMASSLISHEQIETTDARAKELRRVVDRLVTLGKKNTLHARRLAYSYLNDHQLVKKLFDEIAPRFSERPGGYTRLIKSRIRQADHAPMTFIRFVDRELEKSEKVKTAPVSSDLESKVKAGIEEELVTASAEVAEKAEVIVAQESEEVSDSTEEEKAE